MATINLKARISRSLALVLVHDLLCSKQGIAAATGPVKEAILRHKTRLKSEYVRAQLARNDRTKGMLYIFFSDRSFHASMGEGERIEDKISGFRRNRRGCAA